MGDFSLHGGRLATAAKLWPAAPLPWIDLSTGINPDPYPAPRASRAARARLPFPEEVAALEAAAGAVFGLRDPANVVALPGAEAGLRLLPHLLGAETVFAPGPTYASHGEAWAQAGARQVGREEDARTMVLVDPNNPDGRTQERGALLALADRLRSRGGWLIVDESFADVSDRPSIAAEGHSRILALRSFGKFYGLAGLRLGFALAPLETAARLRRLLGDWPIGADAVAAGLAAYADATWRIAARERLRARADRLDRMLARAGLKVIGGTSLFRLAEADDAGARFDRLAAAGILTRPFDHSPRWLRFGLPRAREMARLDAALARRA
ncbi:aminotransferase class I/II-fold pyridoxal phosphate-dependent enzyme [Methylosinus sp. Sm6]|uniref:aminotransferase class I/II-fold pyridoxal phosphate-dependent enzyme n=1 Tax=Methylosinus sp. Sm6 TaxID=2866948 RepID=UPI001C999892|nr:aminotransferase class I/II-fold pyridoxal phosphate-dependent enzyme [Methylosinus sp. Sm6]MBY6241634.1 aminotransferase class I/II-fold pyridoxal phosphate-dependent enzyme [Methylosinus sp. Sm6]